MKIRGYDIFSAIVIIYLYVFVVLVERKVYTLEKEQDMMLLDSCIADVKVEYTAEDIHYLNNKVEQLQRYIDHLDSKVNPVK